MILVDQHMVCHPFTSPTHSACPWWQTLFPERTQACSSVYFPPLQTPTCTTTTEEHSLFAQHTWGDSATKTFKSVSVSEPHFCGSHNHNVPVEQPSHSINSNTHRRKKSKEFKQLFQKFTNLLKGRLSPNSINAPTPCPSNTQQIVNENCIEL